MAKAPREFIIGYLTEIGVDIMRRNSSRYSLMINRIEEHNWAMYIYALEVVSW